MKPKSIVVLISGSGSNLRAIINATLSQSINADITAVISNRPDAKGLKKAEAAGITTHIIDNKNYAERKSFDDDLLKFVREINPTLIILAGFMRMLSDDFIDEFNGRIMNIHPSLLPAFKGLNTHQRVLDEKCETHGASVHFVSSELDSGSVIIQAEVPVFKDDTVELLAARVLEQEHTIYPLAIQWFIEDKLCLVDNKAHFKQREIRQPAKWIEHKLTEPQ